MADATQSFNRNRAVFIFAVGLIILVAIFLGGLYFSGQRGNLQRLATEDKLKTESNKEKEQEKPKEEPAEPKKEEAPKKDSEKKEAPAANTEEKKEPPKNETVPEQQVARTGPSEGGIPKTGANDLWLVIPIVLVILYISYEYRRSRQAIQRAAFHENSAF